MCTGEGGADLAASYNTSSSPSPPGPRRARALTLSPPTRRLRAAAWRRTEAEAEDQGARRSDGGSCSGSRTLNWCCGSRDETSGTCGRRPSRAARRSRSSGSCRRSRPSTTSSCRRSSRRARSASRARARRRCGFRWRSRGPRRPPTASYSSTCAARLVSGNGVARRARQRGGGRIAPAYSRKFECARTMLARRSARRSPSRAAATRASASSCRARARARVSRGRRRRTTRSRPSSPPKRR